MAAHQEADQVQHLSQLRVSRRLYPVPHLGAIRLDKLRWRDLRRPREQGPKRREAVKYQRPVGALSMQRIRETLRAALNGAIREELLTFNAAKWVEMPPADRPKPLVWTDARVEHWRRSGKLPGGVDTGTDRRVPRPRHARPVLPAVSPHRASWAAAGRGVRAVLDRYTPRRRGDGRVRPACAVRLGDRHGHPKTDDSAATVALDVDTILILRAHRKRQNAEREAAGITWVETGLMFTQEDVSHLHPADVTEHFTFLARQADLPPIQLHDLRHGAATIALAAGWRSRSSSSGTPPSHDQRPLCERAPRTCPLRHRSDREDDSPNQGQRSRARNSPR